ncbi:spinster family MFS transporter [Sphingobium sp. B1D7B]|uniref:spinster family MFS transporter n=2 Tax=unclassified Sphingobium TaxID=2611147 RepID=UPI002224622E|nr:MFS transporter [Sphingobium sp. B1D7B]MCW2392691.1 putative MFS family arabinose efflux permease [Sphingobium sp. B11D3A]
MQAEGLPKPAGKPQFGPGYRAWLLALTMAVSAFGFIDRVIVATLGQAIKDDLGLSDFQLGILSGLSFAILYSTMGLPIARLAERRSRINIISISVALFSAATVACGMAANFWQLFLLRVGVGIGEAGVQAPAVSLLADHFPKERRGAVMTVMKLGNPVGSVIGALTAGWIGSTYGWRAAIICIAAPGLIVALLFRLTLREPPRGLSDPDLAEAKSEPPPLRAVLKMMAARPEFRHMLIGLALVTLGMYGSGAFYAPFFMRVHDLSLSQVGVFYAVQSGIAATLGLAIAGFGVDLISRWGAQWYALLPALGVLIGAPFTLAGYSVAHPMLALVLLISGAVLAFFHNVPTLVAFQNMVGPRMRATAAFVFFFVTTLVGVGLGPALIGFISDLYANALFADGNYAALCGSKTVSTVAAVQSACTAASTSGIRYALMTSVLLPLWSALHFFLAARAIRQSGS